MRDLYWLSDEQMDRPRSYFPRPTGCAGAMRPRSMVRARRCTTGGSVGVFLGMMEGLAAEGAEHAMRNGAGKCANALRKLENIWMPREDSNLN